MQNSSFLVSTYVAIALVVIGIALALSSIAARNNKGGFVALLVLGVILLAAGVVVFQLPSPTLNKLFVKRNVGLRGGLSAMPKLAGSDLAGAFLSPASADVSSSADVSPAPAIDLSTNSLKRPARLRWADAVPNAPGLEDVITFDGEDSPRTVSEVDVLTRKTKEAHDPKPVPAIPKRKKGYEPPSTSGNGTAGLDAQFGEAEFPLSAGPVYYKPLYNYRTVNEIAQERAAFMSRPDTPELDRHRRLGQLQEAALSIPITAQHDGLMVPLNHPFVPKCQEDSKYEQTDAGTCA